MKPQRLVRPRLLPLALLLLQQARGVARAARRGHVLLVALALFVDAEHGAGRARGAGGRHLRDDARLLALDLLRADLVHARGEPVEHAALVLLRVLRDAREPGGARARGGLDGLLRGLELAQQRLLRRAATLRIGIRLGGDDEWLARGGEQCGDGAPGLHRAQELLLLLREAGRGCAAARSTRDGDARDLVLVEEGVAAEA